MGCYYQSPIFFLLLICVVSDVAGSGPDAMETKQVWDLTMAQCGLFRNETVLRPRFLLWPETVTGVTFRYCCEYQALEPLTPSMFSMTRYSYGPNGGSLVPAPYYDLGVVDARYAWYWKHWVFWRLPRTLYTVPLYCEATDLVRLYYYRYWHYAFLRGVMTAAPLVAVLLVAGLGVPLWKKQLRKHLWEELLSDVFHVALLALMGSCVMEAGVGHSPAHEWRSQLMYNAGVIYATLTTMAMLSALIRHLILTRNQMQNTRDWQWQKVFAQLVALFVLSAYMQLVEDISGRRLEGVALLVLGAVIGASIWSAGVEGYVILFFLKFKGHKGRPASPKVGCSSSSDTAITSIDNV